MKSVIPFTKELDFAGKVSEITSISLEREFEVKETTIEGNLFVTGDYKSHEVSANVIPFSFKIPFTIEIPDDLEKNTISLEISDFAYDSSSNEKITVNIELELAGDYKSILKEEEEKESEEIVEVNPEEILNILESEREEVEQENQSRVEEEAVCETEEMTEETKEIELPKKVEETSVDTVETQERNDVVETESKDFVESEELIMENVTKEEEYATYHIHIVKNGETVETICTMYNSNLSLLADYNDISNLAEGEKLIIPESDEK